MITFRENEKIYLTKRRHRLVLLMELFPLIIFFLLIMISAIILFFVPSFFWPQWLTNFVPGLLEINLLPLLFLILSLLFLVCWVAFFMLITHYYLDCWIVTNERTIHTELKGFFNRTISTVHHDRIQDITVEVKGIFPTFFRYGDLHIQTAGEFREFIFRQIPNPDQVKDIIFKAQKEFLSKKNHLRSSSENL